MEDPPPRPDARLGARTDALLGGLAVFFLGFAVLLVGNIWGHTAKRKPIPLVDSSFLDVAPWRKTYADMVRAKEDLSDYDCYACHDKGKPPPLRFDEKNKLIIPQEHSATVVMGHGAHERNNLCYNCHNEQNLTTLQVRDGREIAFDNIPKLCGSCHGPTFRDWEAGAHGRTSGYWDRSKGEITRLSCANCHNPHSPRIPKRDPAPGPHALHDADDESHEPTPPKAAH
jgi:uncharacterized CHY-type Zn-finger protein